MKKIEAIIRAADLDGVKEALVSQGVRTVVAVDAVCLGPSIRQRVVYRSSTSVTDSAVCVRLEVVIPDERLDRVITVLKPAVERSPDPEFGILVMAVDHVPVQRVEPDLGSAGTRERTAAAGDVETPPARRPATAVVEWVHDALGPAASPGF